jgi:hypothetical protein
MAPIGGDEDDGAGVVEAVGVTVGDDDDGAVAVDVITASRSTTSKSILSNVNSEFPPNLVSF